MNLPPVRVIAWLVSAILLAAMLPAELIQPAAAQDDGLTYSVTVQKYECPQQEGFDAYDSSLDTLFNTCVEPHAGVPFTLSTDNPNYPGGGRSTGDDGGSEAAWTGIPLGSTFTLQEQIPTGYGLPMIACLAYADPWNASGGAANPGFNFGEGSVSATIPESYAGTPYIGCYWFNVPLAQNGEATETATEEGEGGEGQGGRITLRKYTCWLPSMLTSVDADELYDDLVNDCEAGYPGAQFQFSGMGNQTFSPEEGGEIAIDGYAGGMLDITELQPHWPHPIVGIVYCHTTDPDGQDSPIQVTSLFGRGQVSIQVESGHALTCDWFDVFVSGVILIKYSCPDDRDYREPELEELLQACETTNDIQFSLSQESGPQDEEATTEAGGIARWPLEHTGAEDDYETTIEELDAGNYPYRRIYCTTAMPGAYPQVTYAALIEEPRFSYDHPDGAQVACAWFNVPEYLGANGETNGETNGEGENGVGTAVADGEGDVGPVLLRKYVCDDVYPTNGAWGDWISACSANTSVSGFDFGLTNGTTYEASSTTDENGIAGWPEAPSGSLTLTESDTPGYTTGAVFCGTSEEGEPTSFDPVAFSGNSVTLERRVGYIVACLWFNVPEDGAANGQGTGNSYVYVNKYVCAGEYPESEDVNEWLDACANNANGSGFGFLLTDEDQYSEAEETDTAGQAVWVPAPAGQLSLTETDPLGYRTGAVFCGTDVYTNDPVVGDWHEVQNGDTVTIDHQDGYITRCYWFNVQDQPVTIILYKFLCEPGYDETSLSKEYLEGYCAPEEDVSFYAEGPDGAGGTGITDSDGFVTWEDVPAGSWDIFEDERDGYRPLKAYCGLVSVPNGEPPYDETEVLSWRMSYDVHAGATLTCYWFNQRYEEVGKVRFYKYVCDSELDETSLGYEYLLSYCTEPHADVRYDVTWGDGSTDWQQTDFEGNISWNDVPIGPLNAYENVPAGYRLVRVYCNHYLESQGPAPDEWNNVMQGTNQMAWADLWDGYVLECYWFNVEYEDTGYGSVTIYKYACPEGYDPSNTTPGYHASYCVDPHEDVEFDLTRESDTPRGGTSGEDGSVSWTDVQDGSLEITEVLPTDYITVYIECATYPRHAAPGMYEGVSFYEGRTMNYHLQEGYSLTCYWYNAPYEDEYGTVTIYKYTCPEGYEHDSLSKSYLDSYCTEPYEGVDYDLYYEEDEPITMTTSDIGEAFWDEVYGGSLQLYEYVPDGYFVLRVYCTAYPASGTPGEYSEVPIYDGASVYYHLPPGYSLTCYWYNTPVAGGWIEITKYACPAGYDPSHATAQDYEYSCQQRMESVEYFLDRHGEESESMSGETDTSGYLRFEPLEYGAYYDVVETYPDGYDAAVVYCTRYTPHWGGEGPWERYAVYNGAISIQLHEGEYLRCRWYNLEEEYGVNIRITKYACHEDAWEYSRDELFEGCEEWMSNVRFYVNVGYDRISGLTSLEGEVAWEGVPAGLIRIEETPPEGYGNRVRVYCRVVQGDQVGEWQSANVYDGIAIEYGMAAGNTLDCYWYNFPVNDTGATVTVYKYHCHAAAGSYSTSLHSMKSKCVPLAGMRLTLAAPGQQGISRITGEEGIAAWQGVPAGDIAIGEQHVYGYGTPVVYCAVGSETPERVFSGGSSIEYELEEGDALRCDWFNISEVSTSGTGSSQAGGVVIINNSASSSSSSSTSGGIFGGAITTPRGQQPGTSTAGGTTPQGAGPVTLTIIKYVCPSTIDLEDPASQPNSHCESTEEPVSFNLRAWDDPTAGDGRTSQSTPPDIDTVTFSNLEAGEYILTELPAEDSDIAWAFVLTCESSLGATESARFYPLAMTRDNLSLHLTLYAGERLTCHWYNVPGGGTSVSLTVYECPGAVANPSQCVIASAPHTIIFTPAGPTGEPTEATTGPTGTAEVDLSNGTYEVEDAGANACLIDSNALDDSNNLAIDGSMPVEVVIYTCAA